jgi:hypothetical protein
MLLTMREKTRIEAVQAVMDGRLTAAEAATALNLSQRQLYRLPSAPQLDRILCLKEWRVVGRDHTVSFDGLALQLTSGRKYFSLERQRVEVLQLRDGSVEIQHEHQTVTRFLPSTIVRLIRKNANAKKRVA